MNEAALAKLPEDVRKVFLDKAREWAPKYRNEMIEADAAARKTLVERGMKLREATADETAKLRQMTQADLGRVDRQARRARQGDAGRCRAGVQLARGLRVRDDVSHRGSSGGPFISAKGSP